MKRNNNFDYDEVNFKIDRRGHIRVNLEDGTTNLYDFLIHTPDTVLMKRSIGLINRRFLYKRKKKKE